jgi:DNA (cytosine-5)-methyltransferase 1
MRSLEIFSGAGGLAKGLELAGFDHAAFVEFNKYACDSLRVNFDENNVFYGDIKDFDLDSVGKVDMVAGGPPCQPFSLGGKHKANQDSRDMFPYAIRTIEKLRPKAFVFENVKGLIRSSFADYFEYIILRLSYPSIMLLEGEEWKDHLTRLRKLFSKKNATPEYNVKYKLINAANYGVPQTRERVFIVGFRADLNINYDFPKQTHSQDRLLWDMVVTKDYYRRHNLNVPKTVYSNTKGRDSFNYISGKYGMIENELKPWRTVRDAIGDVPDPQSNHGIIDHIYREGARSYAGHTGSEFDWPSKTIKAGGHGVPGGENMIRYDDGSVRYYTVYEAKKIQTFPDDFVITGAWGEALRQIGNAVPVMLGEIMARSIIERLVNQNNVVLPVHEMDGVLANNG